MGGTVERLCSYVSLEARVPKSHPLRPVRRMVDEALGGMSSDFEALYASTGRRSIAPERLLRARLLQILYSVRSERMLVEQLDIQRPANLAYDCHRRSRQSRSEVLATGN